MPDIVQKQTGLSSTEIANILQNDLASRKYILTGDMTTSIFAQDCRFEDPNNAVDGLDKYRQALSFLFQPDESSIDDVSVVAEGDRSVVATYTARGVLKLPWHPVIQPWTGRIVYSLEEGTNLITSQVDRWNITRWDAIRQTFSPAP